MVVTYVEGVVSGPAGVRRTVRFLVDSGASCTLLPEDVWKALGHREKRTATYTLAEGTSIERRVSKCHLSVTQGEGRTPVILGEPGDEAVMGVVTLEALGLVLHPFTRELHPMRLLMAGRRVPG